MLIISLLAIFAAVLGGCWWLLACFRQTSSGTLRMTSCGGVLVVCKRLLVVLVVLMPVAVLLIPAVGATTLLLAFMVAMGLVTLVSWVIRLRARQRQFRLLAELPDALSQMASSMQAGATLTTAMRWYIDESPGPLAQELSVLQHEHRLGAYLEDALHRLGDRVALKEMDLVVCSMLVARETGGNLAGVLSQLSAGVRAQLEIKAKIRALTAQGVMQGWIVSLLPVLVGAALLAIDPLLIKPLFSGLLGWLFLGAIVILEVSGAVVIRRIVSIDV